MEIILHIKKISMFNLKKNLSKYFTCKYFFTIEVIIEKELVVMIKEMVVVVVEKVSW